MVQDNYIGGLFGFTLFAIVLHYFGKLFLNHKKNPQNQETLWKFL